MDWLPAALFALLISATIRHHSLAPMPTMARTVSDLLAVVGLAFVALLAQGRRIQVARDLALMLLALAVSVAVSVLGTGVADYAVQRLELYLAMVLLATATYLTYRDRGHLPLEACFLAVALVHLPFLMSGILWIRDLRPPFWDLGHRLAEFQNVRQFAEFAFFAASCATGLGVLSRRYLVPAFLLATAALFGIVLTGSRGAALAWMLFVVLACLLGRARLRTAVLGVLVLAAAAGLVLYLDRSGLLPSPNLFTRIAGERAGTQTFDASRLELWRLALRQIVQHPLFGSGPEGYWLSGCCDTGFMQSHNFVLQFLLEFGAIGCGIVVLIAVRAVRRLGGLSRSMALVCASPANRVLASLLAAFLAYSLIDQTMYHLVPLLLFAPFAGLFAAGIAQSRARQALADGKEEAAS